MEINLSIENLELIAHATFQQLLSKKEEHQKARSLIGNTSYHSSSGYLMHISQIGHELNALRDLVHTIDDIIYKHNNQLI